MGPPLPPLISITEHTTDTWKYPAHRTPGAFRAIELAGLITGSKGVIKLYEWQNYVYPLTGTGGSNPLKSVYYAAVSHVWQYAFSVDKKAQKMPPGDRLVIPVMTQGKPDTKTLSWAALKQLALAIDAWNGPPAKRKKNRKYVKYIWLDFLCLDQIDRPNDDEKTLQICIMGDIYANALTVTVMIGGMGAVIQADQKTRWMDRSWTLQEAVINGNIWVLVNLPKFKSNIPKPGIPKFGIPKPPQVGKGYFNFISVNSDDYLIRLEDLLDIADYGSMSVKVLDGTIPGGGDIARHALRAALCRIPKLKNIKYTGIWRSMFLRTADHPIDVVYSVMGLFGLQIDPYRKNRDVDYLFGDLARKAAASTIQQYIGAPCWLTLGRITSNSTAMYIPRDTSSQLIPQFPDIKNNTAPTYKNGISIVDIIDDSGNFIKTFDMKFITHSHPHIINALITPLRWGDVDVNKNRLIFQGVSGMCYFQDFYQRLANSRGRNIWTIYVGVVGDMSSGKITWPQGTDPMKKMRTKLYDKGSYLLFMVSRSTGWQIVGNGIFMNNTWTRPSRRYIITVGENAQLKRKLWVEDMADYDGRIKPFQYHSYGILPLPNYPTPNVQRIKWFGYKGGSVPTQPTQWQRLYFDFDIQPLLQYPEAYRDQILNVPKPLYVITALTPTPPSTNAECTQYAIRELGEMYVRFSWGGWSVKQCQKLALDGVEGVILPRGQTRAVYRARLRFGRCMIYVELKQNKYMLPQYYQTYVLPYGNYAGTDDGQVMNANFIRNPTLCSCAPLSELGLPPIASNRDVGEAIARRLQQDFPYLPQDQAREKAMLMWGTNLSGLADLEAWELRKKYCFRGLPPGNYGINPYLMIQ